MREAQRVRLIVEALDHDADRGDRPAALYRLRRVACEFVTASRKLRPQGFTMVDAWDRLTDYRILHAEDGWSFWDAMIVAACLDAVLLAFTRRTCQAALFAGRFRL